MYAVNSIDQPRIVRGTRTSINRLMSRDASVGTWHRDPDQEEIIKGPVGARWLINAPPGTGKTAVAIRRIEHLLRHDIAPHQIWLISFTRTAVFELRKRIAVEAESLRSAYGVNASTLDSKAWNLVQGFEGTGMQALKGGYGRTIQSATQMLRQGGAHVDQAFDEMAQLIVDEAQDLVGERAELVQELIRRAPAQAGMLIFSDDAQSIYGFAEEDRENEDATTLPMLIRGNKNNNFSERTLRTVYRTTSPNLKRLFVDVRQEMLKRLDSDPERAWTYIADQVRIARVSEAVKPRDAAYSDGHLILYRTRFEVIEESSYLAGNKRAHRLRMSGLPNCLSPWLGIVFSKHTKPRMTRAEFVSAWPHVTKAMGANAPTMEQAWNDLMRHAGAGDVLSIANLREVAARPRPPLELCMPDFGIRGPILSTIHASKGREADRVSLMLPEECLDWQDEAEETRVLFVGATRSKQELAVGTGRSAKSKRVEGRVCAWTRGRYRARIELGREHDYQPNSVVSRRMLGDAGAAGTVQEWLAANVDSVLAVKAVRNVDDEYRYWLRVGEGDDGMLLGRFHSTLNSELFNVAKSLWPGSSLKPPSYMYPLFMLGTQTMVLPPDHDDLASVYAPYSSSGFWLAPMIIGFPTVPFFERNRR